MIRVLAGISPGNMYLTRREIDDHRSNGIFPIQRVNACNIMVTD
jgi:hypothetical protein